MPVWVELRRSDATALQGLPDPAGGSFDAAGDFDRYIGNDHLPVLGAIDPNADTRMASSRMEEPIRDIDSVLGGAHEGPEIRGLLRLKAMAQRCQHDPLTHLFFAGD